MLRTEMCEIGCQKLRSPLPIYSCARFGECCPWRWQQKETMKTCVGCVADGLNKAGESDCGKDC